MGNAEKSVSPIIEEYKPLQSTDIRALKTNTTKLETSSIINKSYKLRNYYYQLGIDSIHITSEIHPYELRDEFSLHIKQEDTDYVKYFKIYLNKNNTITCRYHKKSRTYTYEFGGLCQLKITDSKLLKALKYVYSIDTRIKEIHFALDVKASYQDFTIDNINYKKVKKNSGIYNNSYYSSGAKKVTLVKYDKNQINDSKYGDIAYIDIARLELRLHRQYLSNSNIQDSFYNLESLQKLVSKVIKEFNDLNIKYDNKLLNFNELKVEETLYNFIEFLQSNLEEPKHVNKKFIGEIKKQRDILDKLKGYFSAKTMKQVKSKCKKRKVNLSAIQRETGISRDTLRKVSDYYGL